MSASQPLSVLIVESRFYKDIADELLTGTRQALGEVGASSELLSVPGALEIPGAISFAKAGGYDGFVALGCVIRGETSHYDIVAYESARGLQDLALRDGLAIGNGILTVENREQAFVRARHDQKNKGRDAAEACLAMIGVKQRFGLK